MSKVEQKYVQALILPEDVEFPSLERIYNNARKVDGFLTGSVRVRVLYDGVIVDEDENQVNLTQENKKALIVEFKVQTVEFIDGLLYEVSSFDGSKTTNHTSFMVESK